MKVYLAIFLCFFLVGCSSQVDFSSQDVCKYNDSDYQWIAKDPNTCKNVRYGCDDGQKFLNSCGCGCIIEENHNHEEMIDRVCIYTDPNATYLSKDYKECSSLDISCDQGDIPFSNICGCGCIEK